MTCVLVSSHGVFLVQPYFQSCHFCVEHFDLPFGFIVNVNVIA